MAVADVLQVSQAYLQLHDPKTGAYRACALCLHGDAEGVRCRKPAAYFPGHSLLAMEARSPNGACGPHGLLLDLP